MAVTGPGRMAILDSINLAMERARDMMFRPFSFGVWIQIGLIAFLDSLGRGGGGGGGGGSYNPGGFGQGGGGGPSDMSDAVNQARTWITDNLAMILVIGSIVTVIVIGLALLLFWLSSRGHMMLIRGVAVGRADLGENWRSVADSAWSLFLFKIALAVVGFVLSAILLVIVVVVALPIIAAESGFEIMGLVMALLPLIVVGVLLGIAFALVSFVLYNFVTPLMYRFGIPCIEAWRHFFSIASGNWLAMLGYLGLKIVIGIGIGMLSVVVGCVTLCIGFLPVIHHTIFAPYYVFDRAFSLYVVQSLGPDYTMIAPLTEEDSPAGAAPPPPPPPMTE